MLWLQQSVLWLGSHPHTPEFYSTNQRLRTVPGICYSKTMLGYFLGKSQAKGIARILLKPKHKER